MSLKSLFHEALQISQFSLVHLKWAKLQTSVGDVPTVATHCVVVSGAVQEHNLFDCAFLVLYALIQCRERIGEVAIGTPFTNSVRYRRTCNTTMHYEIVQLWLQRTLCLNLKCSVPLVKCDGCILYCSSYWCTCDAQAVQRYEHTLSIIQNGNYGILYWRCNTFLGLYRF